jgi:hypothetical protein
MSEQVKDGGPGEIPPVPVLCQADAWDNTIRAYGVVDACEWFGHDAVSKFTADTIQILRERSDEAARGAA